MYWSRISEKNRAIEDVYYHEELVFIPIYAVMETKKSHDLLSRKADDVRPSPKAGENKKRFLSSNSEAEKKKRETNSSLFLNRRKLQQIG